MVLSLGEILVDIFPKYRQIGGAPFNFAYHLKQLDIPVHFISRVGKDRIGTDILSFLDKTRFDNDDIQIDSEHPSGRVLVDTSQSDGPKFDIVADVAYDHLVVDQHIEKLLASMPDLIYFGTLIQRTITGRDFVSNILSRRSKDTRCFLDINLRPGCFTDDVIFNSLKMADILKLNIDELYYLQKVRKDNQSRDGFVAYLKETFDIEWVALTLGKQGSVLYSRNECFKSPPVEVSIMADSVGAGDAYASILALGYLKGWPPDKITQVASDFAARICEIKGAIPADPNFYKAFERIIRGKEHEK